MASISVPTTIPPPASPFTNTSHLSSPSISAHARRKSRDPRANPLPTFSFNPAPIDLSPTNTDSENQDPGDDAMATRGHMRRISKPPPLPDFSFNPGASMPVEDRPSPTHPVLEEMALNQQRVSRSARPAPLPAFTFSPGASAHTSPSPTRSEFGESALSRPLGGHKRSGSEFVGGGGVDGPTLVSTSPAKPDNKPAGPPVAGAGRRGHIHRRSQAISITDIDTSELIKTHAVAKARTTSQPSTPAEAPLEFATNPSPTRPSISAPSPPASPRRRESSTGTRPRVEFAEKIDVIPRPLSMISSETEGSVSTARFGHSLNNSINSIASPARVPSNLSSPVPEQGSPQQRPKTADAATLLFGRDSPPEQLLSVNSLPKRPLSASSSPALTNTEGHPVKKKHFWFSHSPDRTPTGTPKSECADPLANLPTFARFPPTDAARPKTSPERASSSMKRNKYHTWKTSIFSKKSKNRASKPKCKQRTPTPPSLQRRPSDMLNEIFDEDNTVVLRSDAPVVEQPRPTVEVSAPASPPVLIREELASPVLDLDAALGPFGSDARFGGEQGQKRAASRIAKLHSSERRGNVDAFGVLHRRTESAPSMPAFNRGTYGPNRDGSNASLVEDVFDEEEEDIFLAGENKTPIKAPGKVESSAPQVPKVAVEDRPIGGLGLSHVSGTADAVVIVDSEQDVTSAGMDSSRPTLEAPMMNHVDLSKRPMTSPMSFAYTSTQSHYASSTEGRTTTSASMISSPDPDHIHFDSAVNVYRGYGEQQSPDFYLRPSNEDLPSLSDSVSSTARPRPSDSSTAFWYDARRDQRAASMFVPGSSRSSQSWKRSSLATLNRLIPGSANGSKLKFETTPDSVCEDRSDKKPKRLSKLLNFLRPKDKVEG